MLLMQDRPTPDLKRSGMRVSRFAANITTHGLVQLGLERDRRAVICLWRFVNGG